MSRCRQDEIGMWVREKEKECIDNINQLERMDIDLSIKADMFLMWNDRLRLLNELFNKFYMHKDMLYPVTIFEVAYDNTRFIFKEPIELIPFDDPCDRYQQPICKVPCKRYKSMDELNVYMISDNCHDVILELSEELAAHWDNFVECDDDMTEKAQEVQDFLLDFIKVEEFNEDFLG